MSGFTQSRFATLKTTLLVGVLIATPVVALVTHIEKTSASDDKNVCVTAKLKSNPLVISRYGNCYTAPIVVPSEVPVPEPVVTPTPEPTLEPEPVVTPTPEATSTPEPTPEPTASPTPTAEPTPTATPTVSPTPTPTHTPDVIVSPTPTPTEPVVPPAPDPIPIPPANTDPSTKEFMFCHAGAMHSNSFTGMMNGHHDKHPDDIIPPIPFKFYGGWNWTADNAKAYYNNCVPVK